LTLLDLFKKFEVIFIVEGRDTAEQNEQNNADTPEIAVLLVGALLENLRSDVARGSASGRRECLAVNETSQSKVRHFHDRLIFFFRDEKQVFGFDVSVDNIEVVAINQSIKDGCDNISCFFLGELLLGQNLIEKLKKSPTLRMILRATYFASRHQLHHQVVVAIVFVNIVEFANVGMVNLLQDVDLVLQSNSVFIVHFASEKMSWFRLTKMFL